MLWLVMAILSALFAGLTSILAKCGIKKIDSDIATALRTIVVHGSGHTIDGNLGIKMEFEIGRKILTDFSFISVDIIYT